MYKYLHNVFLFAAQQHLAECRLFCEAGRLWVGSLPQYRGEGQWCHGQPCHDRLCGHEMVQSTGNTAGLQQVHQGGGHVVLGLHTCRNDSRYCLLKEIGGGRERREWGSWSSSSKMSFTSAGISLYYVCGFSWCCLIAECATLHF